MVFGRCFSVDGCLMCEVRSHADVSFIREETEFSLRLFSVYSTAQSFRVLLVPQPVEM
jgi:hypothetical protein